MKRIRQRLLNLLLFVLFLGVLVWMVIQAGPSQLWSTICSMPGTLVLCVLVWFVGYLFNTASFREVLLGMQPALRQQLGFWHIFRLTITGYAINYITPFGLLGGEPYRVYKLRPYMGGVKPATHGVVLYSTMHIVSHIILWNIALVLCFFVIDGDALSKVTSTLAISLGGMFSVIDWRQMHSGARYRALTYEFISRLVNVIEYVLIMQALGFSSFGYVDAYICVAFSSLFANMLFFSPMQMGTREGGIFLVMQLLLPELDPAELLAVSVSLSFGTRVREIVWVFIGLFFVDWSAQQQLREEMTIEKSNVQNK